MALTPTALQDAIVQASALYGGFENRLSEHGALQAYIENAPLLFPAGVLSAAKNSPVQPVKIPMLQRGTAAAVNSRTCTITGQTTTSEFKTINWGTTGFEIKIVKAKNAGNYITAEQDFAMQLANGIRTVAAALDTAGYNAFESNKCVDIVDAGLSALGITTGAALYSAVDYAKLYQSLPTIMQVNDLTGQYLQVASPQAKAYLQGMLTYGAGNQQNQALLIDALGYKNYFSNRVLNGAGVTSTAYLAPVGSIGMFTWNAYEAKNNVTTSTGKKFYTLGDPILGLTWDVMEISDCETDVNYQRVVADVYQFNIDYAFVTAYTSDSDKTPIIKVEIPTTVNP